MGEPRQVTIGEAVIVESRPSEPPFWVTFEDDGETGYLYANDLERGEDDAVFDALHLYDVHDVEERERPRELRFDWSADDQAVALVLDGEAQAMVDFAEPRLMCRTGFPAPGSASPVRTHDWDDGAYRARFG